MAFLQRSGTEHYFFADRYIGSNARIKVFHYITPDTFATVEADGYFEVEWNGAINPGDIIHVRRATNRNDLSTIINERFYRVVERTATSLVVEQQIGELESLGEMFVSIGWYDDSEPADRADVVADPDDPDLPDNTTAINSASAEFAGFPVFLPGGPDVVYTFVEDDLTSTSIKIFGRAGYRITTGDPLVDAYIMYANPTPQYMFAPSVASTGRRSHILNLGGSLSGAVLDPESQDHIVVGGDEAGRVWTIGDHSVVIGTATGREAETIDRSVLIGAQVLFQGDMVERSVGIGPLVWERAFSTTPWDHESPQFRDDDPDAWNDQQYEARWPTVRDFYVDPAVPDGARDATTNALASLGHPLSTFLPTVVTSHASGLVGIGRNVMNFTLQANDTVAIGYKSGGWLITASDGVMIGKDVLSNTLRGSKFVVNGAYAAQNTVNIQESVVSGYLAASNIPSMERMVILGTQAGRYLGCAVITAVTNANPPVVTYDGPDPVNGQFIEITADDSAGMPNLLSMFKIQNLNTGSNTFELAGANSTAWGTYTSGAFFYIPVTDIAVYDHVSNSVVIGDLAAQKAHRAVNSVIIGGAAARFGGQYEGSVIIGVQACDTPTGDGGKNSIVIGKGIGGALPIANALAIGHSGLNGGIPSLSGDLNAGKLVIGSRSYIDGSSTTHDRVLGYLTIYKAFAATAPMVVTGTDNLVLAGNTVSGMTIGTNATGVGKISFADSAAGSGQIYYDHSTDVLTLYANGAAVVNYKGGVYTEGVTGGDKGAGTGNFGTLYESNVSLALKYQGLDADLTAIAALTTTADGRALLTITKAASEADLVAITGGEVPTEVEHNLVITKVNSIITKLETLGLFTAV